MSHVSLGSSSRRARTWRGFPWLWRRSRSSSHGGRGRPRSAHAPRGRATKRSELLTRRRCVEQVGSFVDGPCPGSAASSATTEPAVVADQRRDAAAVLVGPLGIVDDDEERLGPGPVDEPASDSEGPPASSTRGPGQELGDDRVRAVRLPLDACRLQDRPARPPRPTRSRDFPLPDSPVTRTAPRPARPRRTGRGGPPALVRATEHAVQRLRRWVGGPPRRFPAERHRHVPVARQPRSPPATGRTVPVM